MSLGPDIQIVSSALWVSKNARKVRMWVVCRRFAFAALSVVRKFCIDWDGSLRKAAPTRLEHWGSIRRVERTVSVLKYSCKLASVARVALPRRQCRCCSRGDLQIRAHRPPLSLPTKTTLLQMNTAGTYVTTHGCKTDLPTSSSKR